MIEFINNTMTYPNLSTPNDNIEHTFLNCSKSSPCLFDIYNDPTEHIANENKDIVNNMINYLLEARNGFYHNNETGVPICPQNISMPCACWVARNVYNYFYGLWTTLNKNYTIDV